MKNKSLVTILIIVVLVLIGLAFWKSQSYPDLAIDPFPKKLCFENDTTAITATLNADKSATGRLDFTPPEKDSLVGAYTGTWTEVPPIPGTENGGEIMTRINISHTYSGEGIEDIAERIILISNNYALIDWDAAGPAGISDDQVQQVNCQ